MARKKKLIPLEDINVGDRARSLNEEHVKNLAQSILDDGLLQPIVLRKSDNMLIAGGHRLAAHSLLASGDFETEEPYDSTVFEQVPYVYFEEYLEDTGRIKRGESISDSVLRKMELEENIRRLDMHWTEQVLGLERYHKICTRDSIKQDKRWSQAQTGRMLGMSQANVSIILKVAKELHKGESAIHKCESLTDAIKFLAGQTHDKLQREQNRRNASRAKELVAAGMPIASEATAGESRAADAKRLESGFSQGSEGEVSDELSAILEMPTFAHHDAANMYLQGDSLDLLPTLAKSTPIHHIITDPFFAIDLQAITPSQRRDRVMGEHSVEGDLNTLLKFLQVSFDCIREDGFLVMWYDLDFHNLLLNEAKKIGWLPCRWPFVWCKTSPCQNNAAGVNITKATEVAMFLRRSTKSVLKQKMSKNFVLAASAASETHPFYKPEDVWRPLIEAVSIEGQTVVDPFAGEGSMLVPAYKMRRSPLGIELNENHVQNGIGNLVRKLSVASEFINASESPL